MTDRDRRRTWCQLRKTWKKGPHQEWVGEWPEECERQCRNGQTWRWSWLCHFSSSQLVLVKLTTQFFINLVDNEGLDEATDDGAGYCVFAEVIGGMDVVDAIAVCTASQSPLKVAIGFARHHKGRLPQLPCWHCAHSLRAPLRLGFRK